MSGSTICANPLPHGEHVAYASGQDVFVCDGRSAPAVPTAAEGSNPHGMARPVSGDLPWMDHAQRQHPPRNRRATDRCEPVADQDRVALIADFAASVGCEAWQVQIIRSVVSADRAAWGVST